MITSRKNPRLKAAAELRESRERRRTQRFLIDGARETLRALRSGIAIETYLFAEIGASRLKQPISWNSPRSMAIHCAREILDVAADVFPVLAFGDRSDGIVAVATSPRRTLADLKLSGKPLVGVIAGIEKTWQRWGGAPFGRRCGLDALIVAGGSTDLYNPNTIRASLGTIFSVPVVSATEYDTLAWLRKQKLTIVAAILGADSSEYTEANLRLPTAIVLGSEADGLGSIWREQPDIQPSLFRCAGLPIV